MFNAFIPDTLGGKLVLVLVIGSLIAFFVKNKDTKNNSSSGNTGA